MTNTGIEEGKFHAQRLNYAEALDCFRQELRLQPSAGNCWLQYGFVLEKLGVYAEAITANRNAQALLRNPMAQVAPPPAQNSAAIDAAIAALETNASYWWQRGQALTDLGEYHEAIACLQKSLEILPHNPAWFSHANVAAVLERYDDALASYDQAVTQYPDDYQAWNNRGYVLHRLERYQDAIVSYTHAIRCNPDCAPAWHNHGYALYHLGRYEAAIDSYDKALNINPAYPEAWHNRGNALNALGQYRDAIGSYDRAIALKPEFTEACKHRDLAQACLQRETDVLPQTYTPLSMRDTLPERQVNTLDSWFNQGNSLVYLGRYEEAIATYNKVLTHCPHSEQQSNQVAQQVYRLATVYAQAMELFGQSTDMAWDWLKRPNTHLQGESPLSLLQTDEGAAQVEGILRTMERDLQRP